MRDIDLKTLRLLVAVCEHRNIKRAAQQEHIEPSAISKRIAALEEALGTPLLERRRRGVLPTPAGQALLEHARTVLFTLERMQADAAAFGGGMKGHVRIVASASAIAEALLDDIAAFMREPGNRGIQVDIEERFSSDLVRIVRDGRAALGVCWDHADFGGLRQLPYRSDELALAVHASHRLARRRSIRFEQTLDEEHVGLWPTAGVHRMLGQAAARSGGRIRYRVVVSSFDAAFRVVAANLGISVVPAQVGSGYAKLLGIRLIPLTNAWARRRFAVCYRDEAALPPAARRMLEYLAGKAAP